MVYPLVAAITMDALRMELSNATVDGTVTLQFQETETVYTEPFRSASPVPFLDVLLNVDRIVQAFSDTLTNSAGQATLKAVSISITDKPQISKAEVAEVIAPEEIIPGESVTVSVVLVPHWSTAGDERTIQREVTLEVPEDFPAGEANINVSGSAFDFLPLAANLDRPLMLSSISDSVLMDSATRRKNLSQKIWMNSSNRWKRIRWIRA